MPCLFGPWLTCQPVRQKGLDGARISQLRYKQFWRDVGIAPPLLISLTLTGVKDWKVLQGDIGHLDSDAVFDRDVISPPEAMLSDLVTPADAVLHPLFDVVWNGGGWPSSPNYTDGRWSRPSR